MSRRSAAPRPPPAPSPLCLAYQDARGTADQLLAAVDTAPPADRAAALARADAARAYEHACWEALHHRGGAIPAACPLPRRATVRIAVRQPSPVAPPAPPALDWLIRRLAQLRQERAVVAVQIVTLETALQARLQQLGYKES